MVARQRLEVEQLEDRVVPTGLVGDELVVVDADTVGGSGAILRLDRTAGSQSLLSSGGILIDPTSVALSGDGSIYVADSGTARLVRVNPITGSQAVITHGGLLVRPQGLARAADGSLLVADADAFGGAGGIIRVDPVSGVQTIVSSGGHFVDPTGLALDLGGFVYVADPEAGGGGGAVIRVHPVTGAQAVISSGGFFVDPVGVAVDVTGLVYVADREAFGGAGGVMRLTPSGGQTPFSVGGEFVDPVALAFDIDGSLLVVDASSRGGSVIRIAAGNGSQSVVSFGGWLVSPRGIALMPNASLPTRRFDFNAASQVTMPGYTAVRGTDTYSPARGFGWVAPAGELDRGGPDALLRDGHRGGTNDFRVDLPNGNYQVTVVLGDLGAIRDTVSVGVIGGLGTGPVAVATGPGNGRSPFFAGHFPAAVTAGFLALRFDGTGGVDPEFVVTALEIRPWVSVGLMTLSGPSSGPADGLSLDTVTITGATPSALLTVSTTLGFITTPDVSPLYQGTQIRADPAGSATVTLRRPSSPGTADITVEETTGVRRGFGSLVYSLPASRLFDFNASGNTTAAGYLGVRGNETFAAGRAFGWLSPAGELARHGPDPLRRDAHHGSDNTFRVIVDRGVPSYRVTLHVGDAAFAHPNIEIYLEGALRTVVALPAGSFAAPSFTLSTATDISADGILDVRLRAGVGESFFVLNALEVVVPQVAARAAGPAPPAPPLSPALLAPIVAEAKRRWSASGLSAVQVQALDSVHVEIADLPGPYLGMMLDRRHIRIDVDAAGVGWFVDPTPADDSEFRPRRVPSRAERQYDLLTVVMHELGHVLGFGSLEGAASKRRELMTAVLRPGERRLPAPSAG
ncbi:MAG: NHL repeat-containing protein [Gemmataceae bacterium]|nr:NHL repeat-containing protein [Gemmataceae bacterium]